MKNISYEIVPKIAKLKVVLKHSKNLPLLRRKLFEDELARLQGILRDAS